VYDKDIKSGSCLKQLMMNLDENSFSIFNKKFFLYGEASGGGLILEPMQVGNGNVVVSGKFFNDQFATMASKFNI
jgi:hypothetical protein